MSKPMIPEQPPIEQVVQATAEEGELSQLAPLARAFIGYAEGISPDALIPATHEFILDRAYEATQTPRKTGC
jgi:hypothetical protein